MSDDKSAAEWHPFSDEEPHEEPVELGVLLDEIADVILKYVVIDRKQAEAAALWVVHTYLLQQASVSPIAVINAPERACAKTLFQTVLSRMVRRPLQASNATASALFRSVESWQPTVLLDEGDTFFRERPELHGMVNAGYSKTGFVIRTELRGDRYEPRTYSVYSAKSIAGIALERHLPDATMSRSIVFNMRRKLPGEAVDRLRNAEEDKFLTIRRKLARVAADYADHVQAARPQLPESLGDRAQDNWEPLLAIAACASESWAERATQAALTLTPKKEVQGGAGNELLFDIRAVLGRRDKVPTKKLIELLVDDDERPWCEYNRGKPITPRQLAKLLEVYGIAPKTIRMGPLETPKGYERAQFIDAFERYLGDADPSDPTAGDDDGY